MSITKNTRLKFETTSSRLTPEQRKRGGRRRQPTETYINKGRKHTHARFWRNAKNSNQLKTLGTPDDCRRNALVCRFCGICGIFSPKGRERIGREPKDGSNLEQLGTLKKRKLLALIISRQAKFGSFGQKKAMRKVSVK
jgi:hypothetical protein